MPDEVALSPATRPSWRTLLTAAHEVVGLPAWAEIEERFGRVR